jgi:hypothetical protein
MSTNVMISRLKGVVSMHKLNDELLIETYFKALQFAEVDFICILENEIEKRGLQTMITKKHETVTDSSIA